MRLGSTAVVTGSTGGIGSAICEELAKDDWSLILVNRSNSKASAQRAQLLEKYPSIRVDLIQTDLMDLTRIEESCGEICEKVGEIAALYCVAGVLTSERRLSVQGHESHYAVNVLANYVLIKNLKSSMAASEDGETPMIVSMSSSAIKSGDLVVDGLSNPPKIGGLMGAYAQSKMALTAMVAEMARELEMSGVLIRAIDPGPTKTSMTSGGDGMPLILRWLAPILFSDAHQQAAKIVAAADPAAFGQGTGTFVSSWKEQKLPKSIADGSKRAELMRQIQIDCQVSSS
ncbi:MAG: SDR family NAD(P)-dependent oxidoreductase [Pseudomonadota bacterium]